MWNSPSHPCIRREITMELNPISLIGALSSPTPCRCERQLQLTRRRCLDAYIMAICLLLRAHARRFLARGKGPERRQRRLFNAVRVQSESAFHRSEEREFAKPENKSQRWRERLNRRVMMVFCFGWQPVDPPQGGRPRAEGRRRRAAGTGSFNSARRDRRNSTSPASAEITTMAAGYPRAADRLEQHPP